MAKYLKIQNSGLQRLTFFAFIFLIGAHIMSCGWFIQARVVNPDFKGTWAENYEEEFAKNSNLYAYAISVYWTC